MQDLNVLTCVRQLAPIASQARHFPPSSGEADVKEERNYSFIILNTLLTISYAGFLPLPLVGYGVSLHFRVATLLKTQFACHRVRGKLTIKEERIYSFMTLYTLLMIILCRILTAPVGRVWRLIAFSRRYAPKNTIRLPSLLITVLPPLKNDGRSVLFCHNVLTCVCGNVNEFFYQADVICIIYFLISNKKAYLAGTSFLFIF
ncbi:MAG: hypothetical protein E6330_07840 [Dialister sp.]|nr:hypothetical protein [Dialister sp.]